MGTCAEPEDSEGGHTLLVGQLLHETPGFRRIAFCALCQERVDLPVSQLIETHGASAPLHHALASLTCSRCSGSTINVTMIKLK